MKIYLTTIHNFTIREATKDDCDIIFYFIKSLAIYEKMEHMVKTTPKELEKSLFEDQRAKVLLAYEGDKTVGFLLYFYNYSTFLGKSNLYLEDIFIEPAYRNKGYGKQFFSVLAKIALEENCDRIDWMCLDWNHESLAFYESLGAYVMDEWKLIRLNKEQIKQLSNK